MFTTFDLTTPDSSTGLKQDKSRPQRPKRAQVSRACDWCRLTRVKCDIARPCRNCKQSGRDCLNGSREGFKSVAAAIREVQRLQRQVQELEAKLIASSSQLARCTADEKSAPQRWSGVYIEDLHFGPSSHAYFVHRLAEFTSTSCQVDFFTKPTQNWMPGLINDSCQMERSQQDNFLALFWQGYHAIYPILDEAEFRRHYESLLSDQRSRRPCPLLDIIIALCTRCGSFTVSQHEEVTGDLKQLGHDFYSRAVYYVDKDEGSPKLLIVQAYVLIVVYLLALGDYETAYARLGTLVNLATALGPPHRVFNDNSDGKGRTLHHTKTALWNCLLTLDKRISLHLGRPSTVADRERSKVLIPDSGNQDQIPDSRNDAVDVTTILRLDHKWHRFQVEHHRLFQIAYDIQTELAIMCEKVLEEISLSDFYNHPQSREKCASFLIQRLQKLEDWAQALPDDLKTPRVQGVPFSIDRSSLNLGHDTPLWLQRQRLVLELDYHALFITLTRTFITFSPAPTLGTLSSDNHCISCTNHAIAMTSILHQVLKDTDILTEWYQVVDWQRTAMFAAAGFACGYPICPPTPPSRKALIMAASVFEMSGTRELAQLSRGLDSKVVQIIRAFTMRLGLSTPNAMSASSVRGQTSTTENHTATAVGASSLATSIDFGAFGDNSELDIEGCGASELWGGDASLLWGALMRDMDVDPRLTIETDELAEMRL